MDRQTRDPSTPFGAVVKRNLSFAKVGSLLILCTQGSGPPNDDEFGAWIERLQTHDFAALLIHAGGGTLTAKQRASIGMVMDRPRVEEILVAIMTDSLIARAIMTGLTWFSPRPTKTVGLSDLEQALKFLKCETNLAETAACIRAMNNALLAAQRSTSTVTKGL
jgi:hypothetical protein